MREGKLRAVRHGRTLPLRFRQIDVAQCLDNALTSGPAIPPAPDHPHLTPPRA